MLSYVTCPQVLHPMGEDTGLGFSSVSTVLTVERNRRRSQRCRLAVNRG